ncbi:hypothetical protein GIB67_036664 [Kingdonia uniflora]|uniref:Aminotransferase-like plant mobile domain-containing protein n=1 Tax=Kingdonia uniflora TaxID=39325 RepID=A0A7J7LWF0_9MAGN|nr:hypothetical protein GIB67_036664 [Kingdonia uniflora]
MLPNIDFSHIKSGNVSISHLRTYLTIAVDREDDITISHAFILFMMGHLWFQTANNTVPLGYLTTVADLDEVAQYDWGSAILASLYHGLDTAVTIGGAIIGFAQLLTYWFYEYCGVGHPIVKKDVKYHIDHRTIETITWRPWLESVVSELDDIRLTGTAGILLDPLLNMSPHLSSADLQAMRQAGIVECEQFVIREEQETYASYWANQTAKVGTLLTDSQRMGNIDLFGPSALRAESARDAQTIQDLTGEVATLRRYLDSIDDQLYAHDLHLRRGRNVRVVPLPPGGGARTRQRRSGLQTRGGGSGRSDPSQ